MPSSPPGQKAKSSPPRSIIFYVARGDTDVCGPGCDTWIVGEGTIDKGASVRFRNVLKLAKGNPPLLLTSPGGNVDEAIAIGRMLRERKMTAGVMRTVPKECGAEVSDQACDKLKNSGRAVEAALTRERMMCNSSCVYLILGATRRVLDPQVRLGVHAVKVTFTSASGRQLDASSRPELRGRALRSLANINGKLEQYARDMIGNVAVIKASQAVPHEQIKVLERDDIFKFGIDERDAGDSGWRFIAERGRPHVLNVVFHRHATDGKPQGQAFALTGVVLSCMLEGRLQLSTTTLGAPAQFASHGVALSFGEDKIELKPGPLSGERRSGVIPAVAATRLWLANEVTLSVSGMAVKLDTGRLKGALGPLREMCSPSGTGSSST